MGDFDIDQINKDTKVVTKNTHIDKKQYLKRVFFVVLCLSLIGAIYFIYSYKFRNKSDDITIGYGDTESVALLDIAQFMSFDEEFDLVIDERFFKNDNEIITALNESKIDVAIVEDLTITQSNPASSKNKILASVASAEKYFFVVDVKQNIFGLSDLSGHTIGVIESYKTEYWLEKGLTSSSINKKDLIVKEYKPDKLAKELANAKISGVFAWQPYVFDSETYEGSEAQQLTIPAQRDEKAYYYILTSQKYLESHTEDLANLLRTLISAELHLHNNPESVEEFLTGEWGREKNYVGKILDTYDYNISITQNSKGSLESKYEWSKRKNRDENEDYLIENIYYYNIIREIDPKRAEF